MFYEFPVGMTLDEVRDVTRRHNEKVGVNVYLEADRGDFSIFNYVFSMDANYPPMIGDPVVDRERAILRECRGLTFLKFTGKVINRKFHKFFNLNEKPETSVLSVDWNENCVILEKMDGSMITPLPTGSGIRWATKMGFTDIAGQVDAFTASQPKFAALAEACLEEGKTPMFEWCSRQQRIVIDYPEDRLILLAIRDNETGQYDSFGDISRRAAFHDIELVPHKTVGRIDPEALLAETRDLKGTEGWVIAFDNGHRLKVKADEYCVFHQIKADLENEKGVLPVLLDEKLDDVLPLLPDHDRPRLLSFAEAFASGLTQTADFLTSVVSQTQGLSQKDFAVEVVPQHPVLLRGLLHSVRNGADPIAALKSLIRKNLSSSTKINSVRSVWGGAVWAGHGASE